MLLATAILLVIAAALLLVVLLVLLRVVPALLSLTEAIPPVVHDLRAGLKPPAFGPAGPIK